ncbi:TetR/AcrR family transcriptional regulator [Nonomuraea ceibae]|uniref:TetR/AcrR family transcriptional regulator n=1 Tax=Nonomuraea ceibae TaxID=1935170 RepID=UPI001C606752|nr:TetR/AcrR family transcriptional regulator [Nonomuraea ceibae]
MVVERKRGRPTADERERRRDEILDAAVRLFVADGYQGMSIDRLVAAAKVTKRTVYSYVGDKPEIFAAAVERLRRRTLEPVAGEDETLARLATRIVFTLHSDEAVGLHRLMIAEAGGFPGLAARFYREGPDEYVAALLTRLPEPDPALAEALFALLLGEPHRRRLLGLLPAPTESRAREQAAAALRLLGLDPH